MLSIAEAELELAVFKLVGYSIDRDTDNLVFTTKTASGFEDTNIIFPDNPDYRAIVALIARKASNDTTTDNVPANKVGTTTSNQGGASTCSLLKEPTIIVYDRMFNDYTHNGDLIRDLNMFIAKCLEFNNTITIKELL